MTNDSRGTGPPDPKPFKIGLWGTARSGKTTYLSRLYEAFQTYVKSHQWTTRQDEAARRFVQQAAEALEANSFPEKTAFMRSYHYYLRYEGQGAADRPWIDLLFNDVPGELFEAYYSEDRRRDVIAITQQATDAVDANATPQAAFDDLLDAHGYMIFIDPAWRDDPGQQQSYALYLQQFLDELRAKRRSNDPPRIALILTKADGSTHLWQRRHVQPERCYRRVDVHDERARAARALLGREDDDSTPPDTSQTIDADALWGLPYCRLRCPLYEHLSHQFMWGRLPGRLNGLTTPDRVRCFVASAVGRQSDGRSNVGENNIWKRRLMDPLQVMDRNDDEVPLAHLLAAPPDADVDALRASIAGKLEERADETYYPTSINDKQVKPFGLTEPLTWLIEDVVPGLGADDMMGDVGDDEGADADAPGAPQGDDPSAPASP